MAKQSRRRACAVLALVVFLTLAIVPAAAASPAQAATPPAAATCWYVVQRGDNLTRLAARFHTSVWALMQWNHIQNPNRIYRGQTLRVCAPTPPPPPKPKPCTWGCPPPPPPPCPTTGPWHGEYFNNADLSGAPVFTRQDAFVNFNWGWGAPSPQICQDFFSARWTGKFNFVCTGNYRLTATVDDGIRVWVDGNPVIDEWREQSVRTFSRDVTLGAGWHDFKVEYYEKQGLAEIHFGWNRVN